MRRLAILLAFSLVACNPPNQPPPVPKKWNLGVVTAQHEIVTIRDGVDAGRKGITNDDGYVLLLGLTQGGFTICLEESDKVEVSCVGVTLTSNKDVMIPYVEKPDPIQNGYCGKLTINENTFRCPDGSRFTFRGITWFRLLHQLRHNEDISYITQLAAKGFNTLRVLSTAVHLFDLSPEDGRNNFDKALEIARRSKLYISIVAVADSGDRDYDYQSHSRQIAEICAAAENCFYEWANEPYHGTQSSDFRNDMTLVQQLAETAVSGLSGLLWTAGPAASDEPDSSGNVPPPFGKWISRHLDRGRDGFENIRRIRDIRANYEETGIISVSNEPQGFGEISNNNRWHDCDLALTYGILSRVLEVPSTFHNQSGLRSEPLGELQEQCASDFITGTRIVSDTQQLSYQNTGWSTSPIASADFNCVTRVYSGMGETPITIAFGIRCNPQIETQNGWQLGELLVDRGAVKVWTLVR